MIPIKLLNSVGVERTPNTLSDIKKFIAKMSDKDYHKKIMKTVEELNQPFYDLFSNYGTGIGEAVEEFMEKRFENIVPRRIQKTANSKKLNTVYSDYNKKNNKKPSNYDLLADINGKHVSIEVKTIRAVSKPKVEKNQSKITLIPGTLEERALTFKESEKMYNISFQQTKPGMFDYLLGVVIYLDRVEMYLVPTKDFKNGKLKVSNQHSGAIAEDGSTNEGHLFLKNVQDYKIKTVYSRKELEENDCLKKYI